MKIINIHLNIIISFWLFICLFSCKTNEELTKIKVYKSDIVKVNGRKLSEKQLHSLSNMFNELKVSKREIYSKPDYILLIFRNDSTEHYSIFKNEAFIFNGDYLDAWNERMHGKASSGFKADSKLLEFLYSLE